MCLWRFRVSIQGFKCTEGVCECKREEKESLGGKKTERVDLGVLKTGKELIVCVYRVPGSVFRVLSARKRHI